MKAIAVLFVLSCMSLCLVNSERVIKWGHQSATQVINKQTFVAKAKEGEVQRITFTYPEVRDELLLLSIIKYIEL